MSGSGPGTDDRSWRPQGFGIRHRARDIVDPIIEPLWPGIRVLVHVGTDAVEVFDDIGDPVDQQFPPEGVDQLRRIETSLRELLRAERAIFDGYLTSQPMRSLVGVTVSGPDAPSAGTMAAQMLIGNSLMPRGPKGRDERGGGMPLDVTGRFVFVAVDLLALDGDALLDVPLLERKRLLDSALDEGELVRRGAYVRPPIETWLVSWRALGFSALAYKAANSRYEPGEPNEGWATAPIPTH